MAKTDDLLRDFKSVMNNMMDLDNTKCELKRGFGWSYMVLVSSEEMAKEKDANDHRSDEDYPLSDWAKKELAKTITLEGYKPTVKRYELAAFIKALKVVQGDKHVDIEVIDRYRRGKEEWRDWTKRPKDKEKTGRERKNNDDYRCSHERECRKCRDVEDDIPFFCPRMTKEERDSGVSSWTTH